MVSATPGVTATDVALDGPVRTKLLKGHRWPKDRYNDEIDVGDYLMFVSWTGYPTAALGRVTKIGKTGKVHVQTVKIHAKDQVSDIEVKECRSTTKLSQNMVNALTLDKLARL